MLATILVQAAEPDWLMQLIAAVAALLAVPWVNSFVTGLLRRFDEAADGRVIVYVVSLVITAYLVWSDLPQLPGFNPADPAGFAMEWLALATLWAELAKKWYDILLRNWPVFNPAN